MTGESVTFNFIPVEDWVSKARCRGMDPNIFMPEPGDSTAEIKEICNGKMVKRFNRDKQRYELGLDIHDGLVDIGRGHGGTT